MAAIRESIVVHVPVRVAYGQWTRFEEFPRFMEGVKEVRQLDDKNLHWAADVAGRHAEWDAEIVEQVPDSRIAWRSTEGAQNDGYVEFEPVDEGSTRVSVVISREDESLVEKAGDALGLAERRVRRDLERFKDVVESSGGEDGGWRGEIRDGEVRDADDDDGRSTAGTAAAGAGVGATAASLGDDDDRDRTRDDDDATIGPEGYSEGTRLPSLSRLRGMEVRSTDGEKVGKVKDVYLDSEARYVRYLAVKTGWFSGTHVVPVDDVTFVDDDDDAYVVVPYTAEHLKGAPTFGDDDEMTPERERGIYEHYQRAGYWDDERDIVRSRQTAPAPTPQIAEAEVSDAVRRGRDPREIRVKRWGA